MEIRPFEAVYLDEAAQLLAARHRRHRMEQPLLPAGCEVPANSRQAIEGLLCKPGSHGFVAIDGGNVVGYLLGNTAFDQHRLRSAWVQPAGHAISGESPPDLYADLYAALAEGWVRDGYFAHYIMAPAQDRAALELWFALGFGREQVHALMPIPSPAAPVGPEPGGEVRRATAEDLPRILEVADLIGRDLAKSPCFGVLLPESYSDWAEGWAEVLGEPNWSEWLALREGKVMAHALFAPADSSETDLMIPPDCVELKVAATLPSEQGRGLGRRLLQLGLAEAWEAGARLCATDWRSATLRAARVWPRLGYTPTFYRLFRSVDPRISWATGRE